MSKDLQFEGRMCGTVNISDLIDTQPMYELADGFHELDVVNDIIHFIYAYVYTKNNTLIDRATQKLHNTYMAYLNYVYGNGKTFKEEEDFIDVMILEYLAKRENWKNKDEDFEIYKDIYSNLLWIFAWCCDEF